MTIIDRHPPGACSWVDLMTDDPEKARRFYAALFDWTFEIGGAETGGYTLCARGGKRVAGIGGKPPGAPYPSAWTPYLSTDDLDATLAAVTRAGGAVAMGPMDVMEEGRLAVISDPTGGALGLWQPKRNTGAQRIEEPGAFAWTELNTRDLGKARDFLVAVFGYQAKPLEAFPGGYETLHLGDKTVGGVMQMDANWPAEVPPHWMVYFAVDDTDAGCAKLTELGGKVCVPAFDTPYGRIAVVDDGLGAVFSLIKMTRP